MIKLKWFCEAGKIACDHDCAEQCKDYRMNHKGSWCPFTGQLCQEGICSGCEIYKREQEKK